MASPMTISPQKFLSPTISPGPNRLLTLLVRTALTNVGAAPSKRERDDVTVFVKIESMSFIPPSQTREMFSSTINKSKPIGEDDDQIEILENGHVNLNISKFSGTREACLAGVIASYAKTLTAEKLHHLGYPANLDFDYSDMAQLLHFHLNNAGDPFTGRSNWGLTSMAFERWVLDWFASLWEIGKNEYWGYVTTGGTEGNLHGILVGRELFPDGILYTSQESHYSVFKTAKLYRMKCLKVGTLISGAMDCADLKTLLFAHKDKPAIINVNIGTTLKGAVDDLDLIIQTLEECGYTHDQFYIHCDGALFGIMLPFVAKAPKVTFKKPIGSITISGHKFLGCPIPCGVVISRTKYANALFTDVEYIGSKDGTITGSRSGHTPIFIWYALNKKGFSGINKEVEKCITNATYLKNRLREAGIGVMLNEFSSTVVFEKPLETEFCRRWSLASQGNVAHVVVMQHVSVEMLDSFVYEFVQKRSIWYRDGTNKPPCIAKDIGAENCACTLGENHMYA